MTGDIPPDLSGFCGANINTKLYIFGGYETAGYSDQVRCWAPHSVPTQT